MSIIHRYWAGRDIPAEYIQYGINWKTFNPDYQVVTWNEGIVHEIQGPLQDVIADLYRRDAGRHGIELYVQLADVVGYYLVYNYGGAYFNCDMQPVRPLVQMPLKAWASLENNEDGRIVNAAIGAPERYNEFWGKVIDALPDRYFANPTAEMVETTGPALLTDVAHKFPDEITVFPVETFNPVHWKQIESGGDASAWIDSLGPNTIACHHWGHKKDHRSNQVETATQ